MKKILIFTVILSLFCIRQSIAQTLWQWERTEGGTSEDRGNGICTDLAGNVYVTGSFYSDSITFGNATLINNGLWDVYLVKYDGSGNVLWAKSSGGTDMDRSNAICADANGNVYITGSFNSPSITFDTIVLLNTDTTGPADLFVVKYDTAGDVIWAKREGGTGGEQGLGIKTDANGNLYVTGTFSSPAFTIGSSTLTNVVYGDILTIKYDSSGNPLWAKGAGGTYVEYSFSVYPDASGNVFIAGWFGSSSIAFDTIVLTNTGGNNAFITKYGSTGNVLWAQSAGLATGSYGYGVCTDASGNAYLTGDFQSDSISFGSITLLGSQFHSDIFIVKFNSTGNVLWVRGAIGNTVDHSRGIDIDASSNIYVTGSFYTTLTFDSEVLSSHGSADIFVVKCNTAGNALWAQSAGGIYSDLGMAVNVDQNGNVYSTGHFSSPEIIFGNDTLINAGNYDIFVAKLIDIPTVITESDKVKNSFFSPNPVRDALIVMGSELGNQSEIGIYNIIGESVFKSQISGLKSQTSIDISQLLPGVYFVALTDYKGNKITGKFIKM